MRSLSSAAVFRRARFSGASFARARMGSVAVVLLGLVGVGGCAQTPVVRDDGINPRALRSVVKETAQVRALGIRAPLEAELTDRAGTQAFLEKLWAEEQERVAAEEALLRRLGILEGTPSTATAPRASNMIGGYYDPATATLFVVEDYALWVRAQYFLLTALTGVDWSYDALLSHEITHALQDQHFDLEELLGPLEDTDFDRSLARRAVIESDANLASTLYSNHLDPRGTVRRHIAQGYTHLNYFVSQLILDLLPSRSPRFLDQRAFGNYTLALGYLGRVLDAGGFEALNRAYASNRLPESTEQLLFPEKLFDEDAYDPPIALEPLSAIPNALTGATRLTSNTFGAWQFRLFFEEHHRLFGAHVDVSRWGGDRYEIFQSKAQTTLLWRTVWDDDDAAHAFFEAWTGAWQDRFEMRLSDETEPAPSTSTAEKKCVLARASKLGERGVFTSIPERLCVERRGRRVVVVEGASPGTVDAIVTALWRAFPAASTRNPAGVGPRSEVADSSWTEAPDTDMQARLFPAPRTMHLRAGVRATFRPGNLEDGYSVGPDVAAVWAPRPGFLLSLPFAVTVALPSIAPISMPGGQGAVSSWITLGLLRGSLTSPAVAGGAQLTFGPDFAVAAHVLAVPRNLFQKERILEGRAGGGFVARLFSRVVFSPAVATTFPVSFSRGFSPRFEIGAAHLRGVTRHPLIEIRLFDALSAYWESTFVVEVARPRLIEHTHASGLALSF